MESQNILSGNIDDLKELQNILINQSNVAENVLAMEMEKQKLIREVETEEKLMQENIDYKIKKNREHIADNFETEMSKLQDKLKKVKNERGREKDKKVAIRIEEETKDLVEENDKIKEEYRDFMREKNVGIFWDNKLFMSVFYPKAPEELLILMITLVVLFIGAPAGICSAMGRAWAIFKVLVVIMYVIFMLTVLAFLYRYACKDYRDVFKEVKRRQVEIKKNKAKISEIKRKIKRDNNEERYELHEYDEDIKKYEEQISDIIRRKNEALEDFDKTTSVDIRDEIYNKEIVSINNKKTEIENLSSQLKELETHQRENALKISTNYTAYLGEENMQLDRIEKMLMVMNDGKASTVSEAISVINVI